MHEHIINQLALFCNFICFITASLVYFSHSQYWVYESSGFVQLTLVFYYEISANLSITVISDDITAEGIEIPLYYVIWSAI